MTPKTIEEAEKDGWLPHYVTMTEVRLHKDGEVIAFTGPMPSKYTRPAKEPPQ